MLAPFEAEYGSDIVGSTIVRVRGYMRVYDPELTADDLIQVRSTLRIGNQNEVVRGPDANDNAFDPDSAWLDYFMFEPFTINTTSTASESYDLTGRMIDVKSSRKLEELNQSLIHEVSGKGTGNAAALSFVYVDDLSILIMLP